MDLSQYTIYTNIVDSMSFVYKPTGEVLIRTQQISMDTMLRLAIAHDAKIKGISL